MTGIRKPRCANPECGRATKGPDQPLCWKCYSETPRELRAVHAGLGQRLTTRKKKLAKLKVEVQELTQEKAAALEAIVRHWQ